ncbi:hypothetical protein O1611_g6012 [Lasiodiplodia mahajangana]|uniref:Uncharacterized protein n=1 Tax=Lasiodiplodia mahajangana TaxID=1108764 RepID=A0ACC2JJF0_9PEZI|nr:hypothetical protein O1611_g6012 [Lasiodiplodia mahajangana]
MAQVKFKSQVDESSYHSPGGGKVYQPLREQIVNQALAQGYDEVSMTEHGIDWADDQDTFGHVTNARYNHYVSACNMRLLESFQEYLKDKFPDFINARTIGAIIKSTTLNMKKATSYPDSIIIAARINEVRPDRYQVTTTMWSLKQQVCLAEQVAWVVFFDYSKQRSANLVQLGGVYADLHKALVEKATVANQKRANWTELHPKAPHGAKL